MFYVKKKEFLNVLKAFGGIDQGKEISEVKDNLYMLVTKTEIVLYAKTENLVVHYRLPIYSNDEDNCSYIVALRGINASVLKGLQKEKGTQILLTIREDYKVLTIQINGSIYNIDIVKPLVDQETSLKKIYEDRVHLDLYAKNIQDLYRPQITTKLESSESEVEAPNIIVDETYEDYKNRILQEKPIYLDVLNIDTYHILERYKEERCATILGDDYINGLKSIQSNIEDTYYNQYVYENGKLYNLSHINCNLTKLPFISNTDESVYAIPKINIKAIEPLMKDRIFKIYTATTRVYLISEDTQEIIEIYRTKYENAKKVLNKYYNEVTNEIVLENTRNRVKELLGSIKEQTKYFENISNLYTVSNKETEEVQKITFKKGVFLEKLKLLSKSLTKSKEKGIYIIKNRGYVIDKGSNEILMSTDLGIDANIEELLYINNNYIIDAIENMPEDYLYWSIYNGMHVISDTEYNTVHILMGMAYFKDVNEVIQKHLASMPKEM